MENTAYQTCKAKTPGREAREFFPQSRATSARANARSLAFRGPNISRLFPTRTERFFNRRGDDLLHALAERVHVRARYLRRVDRIVQINCYFPGTQHPVAGAEKFVRPDDAHRHDGHARLLRDRENSFFERLHVARPRARSLGKGDQADSVIERGARAFRHDPQALAIRDVRNRNIAETSHQPAVHGNPEVRLQLESAHELRNRGIDDEGIEDVHVIADKNAGARGVEAGRAPDFEANSGEPQDIAREYTLRPVVLPRIDHRAHRQDERARHYKVRPADNPESSRANNKPGVVQTRFHAPQTTTSSAPGRISSERHCSFRISPSIITFTGPFKSSSTRVVAARLASPWSICVPEKRRGKSHSSRNRPMGLQRTYSIFPSQASARGAIIIFPPVNLLLLKARKRHSRRSQSMAPSRRCANAECRSRTSSASTPRMYPNSPQSLNRRLVSAPTSAGNPRLSRFMK